MLLDLANFAPVLAAGFAVPGLALAGLLLASIPIIIHILNRRRYKVQRWAAMEYLLEALRRNRRRLKFEHWLLMAMRCLAVLLIAFALARPLGCSQSAAGRLLGQTSNLNVIIIDNAASMAWQSTRGDTRTNFDRAKKLTKDLIVRMANSHDAVCVIPAAEGESSAASRTPTYDLDSAAHAIDQIPQRYSRTDLAGALQQALQVAQDNAGLPNRRLYILTDSTRHVWQPATGTEALQKLGTELGKLYEIVHIDVGEKQMTNASVEDVHVLGRVATTSMPIDLGATPRAFAGSTTQTLIWQSGTRMLGTSANVHLDPDTPEQTLPQISLGSEGPAAVTVKLDPPDRLPEDDELSLSLTVRKRLNVLVAEGERGGSALESPAAFIQLALAPAGENEGENNAGPGGLARVDVASELDLGNRVLGNNDAVMLAAVPRPTEAEAKQLKAYVQDGGTLVIFMGEGVNPEAYNQSLLPQGLLPGRIVSLSTLTEGQDPFRFDFRPDAALHPLLRVFRGEQKSGLGTTRIFTYAKVQLDPKLRAQRVLDIAGGDPGITLQEVGRGRVVFVATSADTRWSTLPAKPAFVALLNEILMGTVDPENGWMNLRAGQRLEVPRNVAQRLTPKLSDPTGHDLSLEPADGKSQAAYISEVLPKPGLYRLQLDSKTYPISVRFPPEESDLTRVDPTTIRTSLGNINLATEQDQLPRDLASDKDKNDFGWPVMVAALLLLGTECFLAMWFRK